MSVANLIGLIIAIAVTIFLIIALVRPEKF
jgi:K+-transporting ATPase KdpF subunit